MNYLERLREVLEGNERIEAAAYTTLVRQALRSAPSIAAELLQETYQKGLTEGVLEPDRGVTRAGCLDGCFAAQCGGRIRRGDCEA